jgi:hypothetical protein
MNKREIVQALADSIQKADFESARDMLADDFQFSGPVPEPMDKAGWLGISSSLKAAFPDLDYHFKVIGTEGNVVRITSQLSGTHTDSFDLTSMQGGVIPPTNKTFVTTREKTKITVNGDLISAWTVEPTQGAGMMEILKQLEVSLPTV